MVVAEKSRRKLKDTAVDLGHVSLFSIVVPVRFLEIVGNIGRSTYSTVPATLVVCGMLTPLRRVHGMCKNEVLILVRRRYLGVLCCDVNIAERQKYNIRKCNPSRVSVCTSATV